MGRMVLKHCPSNYGRKPRLLDLGCGTGLFAHRTEPGQVRVRTGFFARSAGVHRTRGVSGLICADSQLMPFASESFDIVTAFDLIRACGRDDALIAEALACCAPGGIALIAVPAHPFLLRTMTTRFITSADTEGNSSSSFSIRRYGTGAG